jgi:hypothetical protein
VVVLDFGASSLEFELRYWTTQNLRLRVQSDMRSALDAAFRRFGIEIPFAQRDVHLRSIDPDLLDRLRGAGRAGGPGAEEPASGNTPTEAADAAGKRALAVPSGPGAAGDGGAGGGSGEEGTGGGSGA